MRSTQIHQGRSIHINLQPVKVENLVHHARAVFEGHGVLKARAPSADYGLAQPRGNWRLRAHNLLNLGNSGCGQHWRGGFRLRAGLGMVLNVVLSMVMSFGYGGSRHRLISLMITNYNKGREEPAKAFSWPLPSSI